MQVAIQGELGSFSHEASLTLLPEGAIVPCAAAGAVLEALQSGRVDAAVIPVENSLAGSVMDFYDLFFAHEFFVERELEMRIRHNLMVAQGVKMGTLRQVLSHPVALAQCKGFFAAHPQLEAIAFYDTAGAVRHVAESQQNQLAAIGSKQAGRQYGASYSAGKHRGSGRELHSLLVNSATRFQCHGNCPDQAVSCLRVGEPAGRTPARAEYICRAAIEPDQN